MRRLTIQICVILLAAPAVVWAGGPTYTVPVDIDLTGNVTGYSCDPWEDTGCRVQMGTPGIKWGQTSTIRIPQFWDGGPVEIRFTGLGRRCDEAFDPCDPPGADTEFVLSLSITDYFNGGDPYYTTVSVPYVEEDENNVVIYTATIDMTLVDVPAGELYVLGVSSSFTNWSRSKSWVGGLSFYFPVEYPFVFENGFESGNAAFWTEVGVH